MQTLQSRSVRVSMCVCGFVLLWLCNDVAMAWLWLVIGWALAWDLVGPALALEWTCQCLIYESLLNSEMCFCVHVLNFIELFYYVL